MQKQLLAAIAILGLAASVQAVSINGSINFAGNVSLNGNVSTATTATFGAVVSTTTTGTYNVVPLGTAVTFHTFTFSPFSSPVPNLWSLTIAGPATFAMTAETLTLLTRSGPDALGLGSIEIRGTGTATGTGFDNTPGTYILTFNTADSGVTFSFSASSGTMLPDGGMTLVLLGAAVTGLGFARRRLS